jgi:hypothetical protein
MLITFFTCAMAFALLALVFPSDPGIEFVAIGAASVAAVLAAFRSIGEDRYLWFSGLLAIAVLLNPIGAVWLNGIAVLAVLGVCLAMVATWLIMRRRSSLAPVDRGGAPGCSDRGKLESATRHLVCR